MAAALAPTPIPPASPKVDLLEQARGLHTGGNLRAAAEAYRQILFAAPGSHAALLGLSLIARQTSQLLPALHMAQAALAAHPRSALAWSNLGETLTALGHFNPARSAFERALAIDETVTAAHYGLGNALAHRDTPSAFADALAHFTRAAVLAPHGPECAFACAFACGKLGRHRDAIDAYRRAITLNPAFASAWLNLGVELVADGRDQLAAPCYGQAIQASRNARRRGADATELSAHLNLGHLARSRQHFMQTQACYLRALDLSPAHPTRLHEVHLAFAYLHLEQQHFPQAWQALHESARSDPASCDSGGSSPAKPNPEIPNARGILLLAEHTAHLETACYAALVEEAIAAFREAEALGHKTAASNRGNALLRLGHIPEALTAHHSALKRDPHHPGVRYNLALTQLRSGNFTEGWPNYEIRWQFREVHPRPRHFAQPRWQGEPLSGPLSPESCAASPPTLFLYAEQGLGDTLQFVRYLPLVAQRLSGIPLLLEVQPPLLRLLSANFADLPVQFLAAGDPIPAFTHHCPLMSLAAIFATTLQTVPAAIPYLRPVSTASSPKSMPALQANADATPRPFTIGLNWAGNPRYRADGERSTTLQTFLPLLQLPGIRWLSLQKGDPATQIQQIPPHRRPIDAASANRDLADTAETIASLDLVLTTDTAVAHLAGALGKPLWLLLPWQSDWRWMQQTPVTPWYPAARLWRQSSPGDWPGLIARIGAALCDLQRPAPLTPDHALRAATAPVPTPRPRFSVRDTKERS